MFIYDSCWSFKGKCVTHIVSLIPPAANLVNISLIRFKIVKSECQEQCLSSWTWLIVESAHWHVFEYWKKDTLPLYLDYGILKWSLSEMQHHRPIISNVCDSPHCRPRLFLMTTKWKLEKVSYRGSCFSAGRSPRLICCLFLVQLGRANNWSFDICRSRMCHSNARKSQSGFSFFENDSLLCQFDTQCRNIAYEI